MPPEQHFTRLVKISIYFLCITFIYYIVADLLFPITSESRYIRHVTNVATQVSGPIAKIHVKNGQNVIAGDDLISIEPKPFKLELENQEIILRQAIESIETLKVELESSKAAYQAALEKQNYFASKLERFEQLKDKGGVTVQQYEKLIVDYNIAENQTLIHEGYIRKIRAKLGPDTDGLLIKKKAIYGIDKARYELKQTTQTAEVSGVITNMHLSVGQYANSGQNLITIITETSEVIADFREKSLSQFDENMTRAYVAFDSKPGKICRAKIIGVSQGVSEGQLNSTGKLASLSSSDRWIRSAQRLRLRLTLVDCLKQPIPTGSRTTVQLISSDNSIIEFFALAQIQFISWLHYVY